MHNVRMHTNNIDKLGKDRGAETAEPKNDRP